MSRSDKTNLTLADQVYIRNHHLEYTPSEIAKNLKKPYCNVYNFMIRHAVAILSERAKREARNPKRQQKDDRFFDVNGNDGNWII